MKNTINSKYIFWTLAIMLAFGVVGAFPTNTHANYGYDYGHGYNNYNYNFNPYGTPITGQYGYNRPSVTPIVVQQPVYVQQPIYVQQPVVVQQPVYYPTYYPALSVSCSANSTYSNNGSVTWTAYASGGNGYYNYKWNSTDGLYGSGQSVTFNYTTPGQKSAYVTVYSNGQSITQSCSTIVNVNFPYYNPYPVYQPTYQPIVYQQSYPVVSQNNNLDIGCFVDPNNAKVNQPVTWSAEVTGGIAPYIYSWTGSDGLSGSANSVIKYYSTVGSKNAIVTVTSADGKTGVRACSNALTITSDYKAPAKKVSPAPIVTPTPTPTPTIQATSMTASSLFSLSNVPWGWVAILIILVLFFTVLYLLFNRQKI